METRFYFIAQSLFVVTTIICLILIYLGLKKGLNNAQINEGRKRKILFAYISSITLWIVVLSLLSLSGFLSDFSGFPPKVFIVIIIPLITVIALTFSDTLALVLANIPPQWLIYIQGFRIIVEVLLLLLFLDNLAPVQMTFEGRNFDILTGLTALIVAYYCFRNNRYHTKIALVWNFLGLGLLLNILIVAILSMPTPLRVFLNEPANTIVAKFPIIFLPGILVPIAYSIHFFSIKQLLKLKR